ncbi:MAG: DUF3488 and DUF4129 domain-containing transglutaminase family protein [Microbacteriaceae bacterium]
MDPPPRTTAGGRLVIGRRAATTTEPRGPVAAEVALWLVTTVAVGAMDPLFVDGSFLPPLLAQAVVAHVVVARLRRWNLGTTAAGLAAAAGAVVSLSWAFYLGTTAWLAPTGETLRSMGDDLAVAWEIFGSERAPAPVAQGFLVAASAAVWVIAWAADGAAFRSAATFGALLPSAGLLVFTAGLDAPGQGAVSTSVYMAAALAFVLVRRAALLEAAQLWAGSRRRGRRSLLSTGAGLSAASILFTMVVGPNLPGAGSEAVLDWRGLGNEDSRVVVNPLVDIRTRLLDQPDVELFSVHSPVPSYWRLTALDQFDGQIWSSSYDVDDASGELPRTPGDRRGSEGATQRIKISALGGVWLPAAYEPVALDAGGRRVGWDDESSTLIAHHPVTSSETLTYQVTSAVPRWTADDLRSAGDRVPPAVSARNLRLPGDLDPGVEDLARELTEGYATRYDKALALQRHLRSFTYDLDVGPGDPGDALASFLFQTQRGYCQQFAGAFGALARSIGIPTRVVVGFTRGVQDPDDPMVFRVRGEHAHAWNEIYLDGFGWVTMDPTPGRAPPGAEQWLGVPEQQEGQGGAADSATATGDGIEPGEGAGLEGDETGAGDTGLGASVVPGSGEGAERDRGVPALVSRVGTMLFVAAVVYLVAVPAALAAQSRVRRRRAAAPAARIHLAWTTILQAARFAGFRLPPSLTVNEAADVLAAGVPHAASALRTLAHHMERVTYAEVTPSAREVAAVVRAGTISARWLQTTQPLGRRILRHLDARRLWQLRRPRRRF